MQSHSLISILILLLDIWAWINIIQSERSTLAKIIWFIVVFILPVLGFVAWLIAGPRQYKA